MVSGYKHIRNAVLLILLTGILAAAGCGTQAGRDTGAYKKGMEALEKEDYNAAIAYFKDSIDQDSRKTESYRGQGIAYLKQGSYSSAITMFERSLSTWKKSRSQDKAFYEDLQYYMGEAYLKNDQYNEAMQIYTDLTTGDKPDQAYLMRGIACIRNGNVDEAMKNFDQVLKEKTTYENCIRIYEELSAVSHKADGASYLQKATDLEPESANDYYLLGVVYYDLGNLDEARDSLNKAIDEGSSEAVSLLGKVSMENGDTESARKLYENVMKSGKDQASAYNGLALCDIADQDYDSALDNIEKGLQAASDDDSIKEDLQYNEIVVYEKKLDFDTAKSKMKEFLEQYPGNEAAERENEFLQTR